MPLNREVYVTFSRTGLDSCLRTNEPVFPRVTSSCAMDSDNRDFVLLAMHLRDRAPKHEHQAEAKKYFADDFCFHVVYFSFLVLAFRDSLRTHFWPFTEVLQEIRCDVTRNVWIFLTAPTFGSPRRPQETQDQRPLARARVAAVECGSHRKRERGAASGSLHRLVRPFAWLLAGRGRACALRARRDRRARYRS